MSLVVWTCVTSVLVVFVFLLQLVWSQLARSPVLVLLLLMDLNGLYLSNEDEMNKDESS